MTIRNEDREIRVPAFRVFNREELSYSWFQEEEAAQEYAEKIGARVQKEMLDPDLAEKMFS